MGPEVAPDQRRREMNEAMERGCGVFRDQPSMASTVSDLAALKGRAADLGLVLGAVDLPLDRV